VRRIQRGSADQSVVLRIIDESTGIPETGVLWNTAGIDLWYRREVATKTSIVEATLATLDAAHADGGFLAIGDGYYRLDLPDAAVASAAGVNGVMVGGAVTGMIVIGCYVELTAYNPYDTVRAGLTALPNAAADAAGGLPISDAGGLDLDAKLANTNEVTAARMGALTDWINGGRLDLILDIIAADTTTDIPALIAALDALIDTVKADTAAILTDTGTTLETDLDAIIAAVITNASGADIAADIIALKAETAAILADTNELQVDDYPTAIAAVKADTAAILIDTGTTLDGRIPAALVGGRMDASIGAMADIDFGATQKTSIQTAVGAQLDAAIAEPANLAATKSVRNFLWHLFSRFYHKNTQVAAAQVTYKADGATPLATRVTSDDGTTQTLGAGT